MGDFEGSVCETPCTPSSSSSFYWGESSSLECHYSIQTPNVFQALLFFLGCRSNMAVQDGAVSGGRTCSHVTDKRLHILCTTAFDWGWLHTNFNIVRKIKLYVCEYIINWTHWTFKLPRWTDKQLRGTDSPGFAHAYVSFLSMWALQEIFLLWECVCGCVHEPQPADARVSVSVGDDEVCEYRGNQAHTLLTFSADYCVHLSTERYLSEMTIGGTKNVHNQSSVLLWCKKFCYQFIV